MSKVGKRLKRWLYLGHRWLGIVTCLLFLTWFGSGVVMMYVGFPRLTEAERHDALPVLAWDLVALTPIEALTAAGLTEPEARRVTLAMLAASPVYRIVPWQGPGRTISAADGQEIRSVEADLALAVAAHHPASRAPTALGLTERDQWSVPQRLDPLRPFHRIALGDEAATELYVSQRTGEIALDTTRSERIWNWFGSVPHWIYFTPLRAKADLWRDVVLWISGVAIVGAATGLIVGILRVRLRHRYPRGTVTPYRGWLAWHHLGGLVAGATLLTFIVSGWLSMNPNRWFSSPEPEQAALERYRGDVDISPRFDRAAMQSSCPDTREVRFLRIGGTPLTHLDCGPANVPALSTIAGAARHLMPDAPVPKIETLVEEDFYWYGPARAKTLPTLRIIFADPAATWFHIDPATGDILDRMDRSNRVSRWLFNGLHTLDLPILTRHRPAWEAILLILSAGGLLIAGSGVVIGWRRLTR